MRGGVPVDDGDGLSVRAVAVREELVVHADVLEALDDRERGAGENGLDVPRRRLVVHRRRRLRLGRCGERRCQGLGV